MASSKGGKAFGDNAGGGQEALRGVVVLLKAGGRDARRSGALPQSTELRVKANPMFEEIAASMDFDLPLCWKASVERCRDLVAAPNRRWRRIWIKVWRTAPLNTLVVLHFSM